MKEKTKKVVMGTTAMTLVSALAFSGTFAYLTKQTEKRANNFTFASVALNARLTEPKWDGVVDYEYDNKKDISYPIYGYTEDGKPVYAYDKDDNPITDKSEVSNPNTPESIKKNRKKKGDKGENIEYGDKTSKDMVPGQVALKNPIITNTGDVSDEWVAAKITFVYADGDNKGTPLSELDMKKVTDAITIDYNADNNVDGIEWDRRTGSKADNVQVFYYTKTLAIDATPNDATTHGEDTKPIFTQVRVKDTATTEQMKALEQMGGFVIYIEGFAVQDSIMETYDADTLADYVSFESTGQNDAKKKVAEPGIISAFKSGIIEDTNTPAPAPEQETPEE